MTRRVLVLDGAAAPALAAVRSLGRAGYTPLVGAVAPGSLAARSRFCQGGFTYPDPAADSFGLVDAVLRASESLSADLVLPVTDWTAVPLSRARERVGDRIRLALPPADAFESALSKSRTVALARELGLPVPPTWVCRGPLDWPPPERPSYPLPKWPVVVKPDRSKVWDEAGRGEHLGVTYAADEPSLLQLLARLGRHGPVLVQPWRPGVGVGLGVLCDRGEIVLAFQHRRLHEVPLSGGGSSWRISEPVSPDLLEMSQALMGALRWHGVALVEARRGPGGDLFLVEVNGRLWGSLPLAVAAGADFPAALADLLLEGRRPATTSYREGVRVRSLTGEVEWFAAALRRDPMPVPVDLPGPGRIAFDLLRMLDPRERWDALSLTDPGPSAVQIGTAAERVRSAFRRQSARREMARAQTDPRRLLARIRRARSLAVVCHGNILRSALAGTLLEASLGGELTVLSAGLGATEGRPAHDKAIERARLRGRDLGAHRTRPVDESLLLAADVVLVMDVDHLLEIRRRFPAARGKTWLLGALVPGGPLEIADPVSGTDADFAAAFDAVEAAVLQIVNARRATG